jgi:outer membrane protein assembly factor BamB
MKNSTLKTTRAALLLACMGLATGCSVFKKDHKKPLPGERISVLQLQQSLEPEHLPNATAFQAPEPWKNDSWPQSGGYSNHDMQNLALNPDKLNLVWKANIGRGGNDEVPLSAEPIVAEGMVFAIDRDQNLTAFDAGTGKKIWTVNLLTKNEKHALIGGGVAYANGLLYITNGFTDVAALQAKDGKLVWKATLGAPSNAAPTISDGRVFVMTLENRLVAYDAVHGTRLWDYAGLAQTAALVGAASPAAANGIVVPGFTSGELDALLVENGSPSWSENLGEQRYAGGLAALPDIRGLPVIDKDIVIAVSFGGKMLAVDQRTGTRIWQKDINSDVTPWIAGNEIFVLDINNELAALARDTGTIHWVLQLQRYKDNSDKTSAPAFWTAPVLAGGRLILASNLGFVLEVNSDTGKVIRQWDCGHKISLPLTVAGETLYMISDDGTLLAYR